MVRMMKMEHAVETRADVSETSIVKKNCSTGVSFTLAGPEERSRERQNDEDRMERPRAKIPNIVTHALDSIMFRGRWRQSAALPP